MIIIAIVSIILIKKAVIDFFNGPGNKYFDKLLNYTEGLKREKSLICYVNRILMPLYLNKKGGNSRID